MFFYSLKYSIKQDPPLQKKPSQKKNMIFKKEKKGTESESFSGEDFNLTSQFDKSGSAH